MQMIQMLSILIHHWLSPPLRSHPSPTIHRRHKVPRQLIFHRTLILVLGIVTHTPYHSTITTLNITPMLVEMMSIPPPYSHPTIMLVPMADKPKNRGQHKRRKTTLKRFWIWNYRNQNIWWRQRRTTAQIETGSYPVNESEGQNLLP